MRGRISFAVQAVGKRQFVGENLLLPAKGGAGEIENGSSWQWRPLASSIVPFRDSPWGIRAAPSSEAYTTEWKITSHIQLSLEPL